jgi:hypothetical protein
MLAVVQEQEERLGSEGIDEPAMCRPIFTHGDRRGRGRRAQSQGGGDRVWDPDGVRQRGQLDEPDAIGKAAGKGPSTLQSQPRLTAPTWSGERQQSCRGEAAPDLRDLSLSPNEDGAAAPRLRLQGQRRSWLGTTCGGRIDLWLENSNHVLIFASRSEHIVSVPHRLPRKPDRTRARRCPDPTTSG